MNTWNAGLNQTYVHKVGGIGRLASFQIRQTAPLPFVSQISRRDTACQSAKVIEKLEAEQDTARDGSNGAAAAQQYSKPRSREWEVTATLQATRKHQLRLEEGQKPLGRFTAVM